MGKIKKISESTILVTGSAGFIGFHLSKKLLEIGATVIGLDNFNDYYDVNIKKERNKILKKYDNFKIYKGDLNNVKIIRRIFKENQVDKIAHLAAQAGVRASLSYPDLYIQSNITGFINLIGEANNFGVKDFIYASSSSVYGNNKKHPSSIYDDSSHPISIYAATKKMDELIAYTYHHLYGMHCTGLRFFTVYGPFGRPDMAYFSFAENILSKKKIKIFNFGKSKRDFTYIDDIVLGIISALKHAYPYEIFNLGNGRPVDLKKFIKILEKELGCTAQKNYLPEQKGDVSETFADIKYSQKKLGFTPKVSIEEGLSNFVNWYKGYYR